jgi:hypothetical protein
VDDRSRVLLSTLIGAVAGGVWGYLYLTESGRRVRLELEPKLDEVIQEIRRMRGVAEKARQAADEGLRSLRELAGAGPESAARWDRATPRGAH